MTVHRSVSKALRYALHIAVVSSAAVACSPGDPASSRPAAYPGTSERERETTIVHEPCDASSKSAQGTDINGDGKPDILWQHNTTGAITLWYMNIVTRTGTATVGTNTDLNWKIRNR